MADALTYCGMLTMAANPALPLLLSNPSEGDGNLSEYGWGNNKAGPERLRGSSRCNGGLGVALRGKHRAWIRCRGKYRGIRDHRKRIIRAGTCELEPLPGPRV